jgi:hypothetical protein
VFERVEPVGTVVAVPLVSPLGFSSFSAVREKLVEILSPNSVIRGLQG